MYYSWIVSFPSLHVCVLDLKPFQVALGHIGFIGHHGAELVWPFMMFIIFQAFKTLEKQKERDTTNIGTPKTCKHQLLHSIGCHEPYHH
jgi:hypothetical protein